MPANSRPHIHARKFTFSGVTRLSLGDDASVAGSGQKASQGGSHRRKQQPQQRAQGQGCNLGILKKNKALVFDVNATVWLTHLYPAF